MLIIKQQLVTIDVFYYMPDYQNLVQEFIYQLEDIVPELYKTHRFLNHWRRNVQANIKEVQISINENRFGHYRNLDDFLNIH